MLRRLSIRDIVLIEALDLEFDSGLCALTGETGAGKSILLDALGLALGGRGGGDLIRSGAAKGSVAAVFDMPAAHPARIWLQDHDFDDADSDAVILRRVVTETRTRGYINDQPANAKSMRELGAFLVEINGQFDDSLMRPAAHCALLDRYADAAPLLTQTRAAWRALSAARTEEAQTRAAVEEARRDADYISHSLSELERLNPQEGEEDRLDADRRRMQRSERIVQDVSRAADQMGSSGAEGAISAAFRRLEVAGPQADGLLDAALTALDQTLAALHEAQDQTRRALDDLAFDPGELESAEERLFALRALARKHQLPVSDLPALAANLAERKAFIESGELRLADAEAAARQAATAYSSAADTLSQTRQGAAARLDLAVMREMSPLRMDRARFQTRVRPDPEAAGPDGHDRVAFRVAANPGAKPGPIEKVASGGELSRFLLAVKVALSNADGGKTLIFDEIDRGVGGATADAIGQRLQRLGAGGQTLVVTHSPQVAARAAAQWRIEKRVRADAAGDETTRTYVTRVGESQRVEELARMLAGETVTDAARSAAAALLTAADG